MTSFNSIHYREDEKDTPVLNPLCDAKHVDIDVSVDIITLHAKLSCIRLFWATAMNIRQLWHYYLCFCFIIMTLYLNGFLN